MSTELNEQTYDSLIGDINTQYFGAADVTGGFAPAPDIRNPRRLERSFMREFGAEAKEYKLDTENSNELFQFFEHKTEKDKRIMRVESPYANKDAILIEIPKAPESDEAKKLIYRWKDVKNMVMFNQESFELFYDIAAAYRTKDPLVASGPPAKSKTFMMWVFGAAIEVPYGRLICSEKTDEEYFKGGPGNTVDDFGIIDAEALLTQTIVGFQIKMAVEEYKQLHGEKTDRKRYFEVVSFLQSVRTLLDLDAHSRNEYGKPLSVTDEKLIPLYSIMSKFTGIDLVRTREYGYNDSTLNLIFENGGICVADEFDRIKNENTQAILHAYMEPDTEEIDVDIRRTPHNIRRHPDFFFAITMNNVKPLPPTIESRARKIALSPVSKQYVKDILTFYFTGKDPDIWIKGKRIKGRQDVKTKLRAMERMPYRDEFIDAVVNIYAGIIEKLGKELGKGKRNDKSLMTGIDQRTIGMLVNDLLANFTSQHTLKAGVLVDVEDKDKNWYLIAMAACVNIFEQPFTGHPDDEKTDRGKVHKLIMDQRVFSRLEAKSKGKNVETTEETTVRKGAGVAPKW